MRWRLLVGVGIVAVVGAAALVFAVLASRGAPTTIAGAVRSQGGGPVAGAVVRVQATDVFVVTGGDGTFALSVGDEPVALSAWAPGFYIAGGEEHEPGDSVELVLVRLPGGDDPDYEWLSVEAAGGGEAQGCAACHSREGTDLEHALPVDEWRLDAHGTSAQNPRFLTMYAGTDVAGNQSPPTRHATDRDYGRISLPPDPTRPYFGPGYKLDFSESAGNCATCHVPMAAVHDPYGVDPTTAAGVAAEGIGCDFCHKITDVVVDPDTGLPEPLRPGVLSLELLRPGEGHQFFAGPFDDVAPGEDAYSALQTESRYCAPCHFGVFWDTVVYDSFGEWLRSEYSDPVTGQTCQDCHMPVTGTTVFALPEAGGRERDPETIRSHLMPGAADEELLREAVALAVTAERRDDAVGVTVAITNATAGHHVPTDSPLRHMILLVTARDAGGVDLPLAEGPTVPEWGGVGDPAGGYYAGLPGTAYAKVLEEVWTGVSPTGAYWNPTRVVADNRIPALGSDTTGYSFAAPGDGPVTVDVRLLFRRAFIELMDQKGWDIPDIVMAETTTVAP